MSARIGVETTVVPGTPVPLVAAHFQALIAKAGIEEASAQLDQAYSLICRTSLGRPVEPGKHPPG